MLQQDNFRFVKADICDRQAVDKLFQEEKPAGRHGFLQVAGDHFAFADGTPLKLSEKDQKWLTLKETFWF